MIDEIMGEVGDPPDYPLDSQPELDTLIELNQHRDDPAFLANDARNPLSRFLTDPIFFKRIPFGAVLRAGATGITTGLELATLFEAETPGLWHRHVLNLLFDPRAPLFGGNAQASPASLSPPRQALVWAALDVAISSALMAAWNYKWIMDEDERVAYRQRPVEFDESFDVLFDLTVNLDADGNLLGRGPNKKPKPNPSPGTPRHPAYPSGHSTYSAAASEVLGCLFPDFRDEFDKLANNIGWARLWGGVHWESDHTFGAEVGRAVGRLIIAQLDATGIGAMPEQPLNPPDPEEVIDAANQYGDDCDGHSSDFCEGVWKAGRTPQVQNLL
jgi:membrane-associated phospholipid phosphatase